MGDEGNSFEAPVIEGTAGGVAATVVDGAKLPFDAMSCIRSGEVCDGDRWPDAGLIDVKGGDAIPSEWL